MLNYEGSSLTDDGEKGGKRHFVGEENRRTVETSEKRLTANCSAGIKSTKDTGMKKRYGMCKKLDRCWSFLAYCNVLCLASKDKRGKVELSLFSSHLLPFRWPRRRRPSFDYTPPPLPLRARLGKKVGKGGKTLFSFFSFPPCPKGRGGDNDDEVDPSLPIRGQRVSNETAKIPFLFFTNPPPCMTVRERRGDKNSYKRKGGKRACGGESERE